MLWLETSGRLYLSFLEGLEQMKCKHVKSSYLWRSFNKLSLFTNMRVHLHGDVGAGIFSERLLMLGNGKVVPAPDAQITMKEIGTVKKGDLVIITKGDLLGTSGGTNAMKVVEVGNMIEIND